MAECCGGKEKLIYACSGCSDVGEVADIAARELAREGFGKMACLAGVGAGLSGFVESAKGADEVIVIDGCPIVCGKIILEKSGVKPKSYVLTEMGLVKGKTELTQEVVEVVCQKIAGTARDNAKECGGGCSCSSEGCK